MARRAKARDEAEEGAPRRRIILAAEGLFARKGFFGATLREISRDAAVNVNLISYYFPEKEDLFSAVIDARVSRLNAMRGTMLDALEAKSGAAKIPVEEIILAFVQPFFVLRAEDAAGWTDWAQAVNREAGTEIWTRMVIRSLGPILRRYVAALQPNMPQAGPADILFLLELVSTLMVAVKIDESAIIPGMASSEWSDEKTQSRIIRALVAAAKAFCD